MQSVTQLIFGVQSQTVVSATCTCTFTLEILNPRLHTVAPVSILNSRVSYTQTKTHISINPFLGNPFLLSNSSLKIQQLVFRSLIPFTKTLSNKSEEHFLFHMSVMDSSRVILLIPSWLYYEFLQARLMMEKPRVCKQRRKMPHKEKQKPDSLLVLSHYYCLISFCTLIFSTVHKQKCFKEFLRSAFK